MSTAILATANALIHGIGLVLIAGLAIAAIALTVEQIQQIRKETNR